MQGIEESRNHFRRMVAEIKNFNDAFELVKIAVMQKFRMHRAGLSLILQMMPNNLGAYHVLGSNAIVVNSYLLAAIKELTRGGEEYNAYLFMVLAHEYLHSLGIVDENRVRLMTYQMCNTLLGEDHPSTRMAKEDPASIYPQLKTLAPSQFSPSFNIVRDFDKKNQSYIQ